MKKTFKSENESPLKDFLKKVKSDLLDDKQVRHVKGGSQPKTSRTRPLTGMYNGAMVGG